MADKAGCEPDTDITAGIRIDDRIRVGQGESGQMMVGHDHVDAMGARSRDAGMCGDAVVYRDDQLRALHEQVVDQRRTQPVTVSRAVRHAIVDVARTEQAQPAHGDGSAGCPVAIEVADDDDALFRPDRILEDLARAPDAADRRRQQCGEAVVQLRGTRDSARGIDSLQHGMSIRAGREIRRQFAPVDARLLHAGSAAATRRQNRQRCIRR